MMNKDIAKLCRENAIGIDVDVSPTMLLTVMLIKTGIPGRLQDCLVR
jgi:hypothetical protein